MPRPTSKVEDLNEPDFSDFAPQDQVVSIPTTWESKSLSRSVASVQTADITFYDVMVQTTDRESRGCQTEDAARLAAAAAAEAAKRNEEVNRRAGGNALSAFLLRMEPIMSEELNKALKERAALLPFTHGFGDDEIQDPASCLFTLNAFDVDSTADSNMYHTSVVSPSRRTTASPLPKSNRGSGGAAAAAVEYGSSGRSSDAGNGGPLKSTGSVVDMGGFNAANANTNSNSLSNTHSHLNSTSNYSTSTNSASSVYIPPPNKHNLVVTHVAWSCTGQTVAASYGRFDLPDPGSVPGVLATWNLNRVGKNGGRPDVRINTDSCLMTCSFHPVHPAIIAGGTSTGGIVVWDLGMEGDPQRGSSDALAEARHLEPVVSLAWIHSLSDAARYGTRAQAYRLVSLGAEGRVLVWLWHKGLGTPVYGYQLQWSASFGGLGGGGGGGG
eukprot:CAMPEP_0175057934 /NCGR_PEP_ID=MMETSP0052_2-20121109/11547_1 /TAXON_ID=51329 ORGANISM="Polytomella parva, Strain SAG 63-3" /NCGR_SAMPLE_ID=MMETSP0052_2 /ASSEMBLY_ACC=CAM_ASM_000194 /LENGTH=440 /DNA_ID=CAMNT_0016323217 /DNA_START=66 /DNA_END=1384 /DNA_ORIENTATION=+